MAVHTQMVWLMPIALSEKKSSKEMIEWINEAAAIAVRKK
jgi:hypothetical protein